MEFYHTKKRLIEAASSKVATDWNNHILSSKAELLWKTDHEAVKKAPYVRVKTKCVPRFSAWVKVLDTGASGVRWTSTQLSTIFAIMICTTSYPALTPGQRHSLIKLMQSEGMVQRIRELI